MPTRERWGHIAAVALSLVACGPPAVAPQEHPSTETGAPHTSEGSASTASDPDPGTDSIREPTSTSSAIESTGGDTPQGSDSSSDTGAGVITGPLFEPTEFFSPHQAASNTWGPGQGWADLNGDGRLDLVTIGGSAPSRVHLNQGDGTFDPWPFDGALAALDQTAGIAIADYDNDGWADLYVLRVGPNVLLRNDEGLGLVDVTESAGVGDSAYGMSGSWGDYDGDGWLDLYVSNTELFSDVLYRSQGDGTFTNETALIPYVAPYQAFAAVWFDYDNDGDPDLYVANDKEVGNQLWLNDGPGCGGWCFIDVATTTGAVAPAWSMGIAVGDYDGDLDLDISFTDNYEHHLLRNDLDQGLDAFTAVGGEAGVDISPALAGWGVVMFDYDNDGWLDLYVCDGNYGDDESNLLFHNAGDGVFGDVSSISGCADPGISYGVSYADYDDDGALDLAVANRHVGHVIYHNRHVHPERHWLTVDLVGGGPVNRDAIGARVWVTTDEGRTSMQEVKAGSSVASTNMRRLHFGFGATQLEHIEIRWPNGVVEVPPVPDIDQRWVHEYPL